MPVTQFKMDDCKVFSVLRVIAFEDAGTTKQGESAVFFELVKYFRLQV